MKKIILFFVLMSIVIYGCNNAEEQEKVEDITKDVVEEQEKVEDITKDVVEEQEKESSEFRIIIDKEKKVSEDELNIKAGDVIVFVNENRINHNILIYPENEENLEDSYSSGNFLPGETFRYTFEEKGIFVFRDRYSSGIRGTIIVE